MSNFLAIATATATLTQMLQDRLDLDVAGSSVKPVRPDSFKEGNPPRGVAVFLYQVTPNPNWRNGDLPSRRADGSGIQRPQAALDLHYLLSFFGDDTKLEPQRMAGSVASALHARPTLSREKIRSVIAAAVAGDPNHFLGKSDLADAIELIRFSPLPLSLEELSRLWSVFFQIPYALSVIYSASVVLIESPEPAMTALPVRERAVYAVPFLVPNITEVVPQIVEFTAGVKVTLRGANLSAGASVARFGSIDAALDPPTSLTQVSVSLPAGLLAGVNTVKIIQNLPLQVPGLPPGAPPVPHRAFESNIAAFILQPKIKPPVFGAGAITVQFDPMAGPRQDVSLLFTEVNPPIGHDPRQFSIRAPSHATATGTLVFPAAGIPPAAYLVRLKVDGVTSALTVDTNSAHATFNQFIGPTVVIV